MTMYFITKEQLDDIEKGFHDDDFGRVIGTVNKVKDDQELKE